MLVRQYNKPHVPKYANYDYIKAYCGGVFVGWMRIYYEQK